MRGSPLIKTFLVAIFLVVLAFVIIKLTGEHSTFDAPEVSQEIGDTAACHVAILFAHQPAAFAVSHLGEVIYSTDASDSLEAEFDFRLPLDEITEGIDLVLTPKWPESTPRTAVAFTLEPEGLESHEQTTWFSGNQPAIFTFSWPSIDG